jgi:hypothetical protein
LTKATVVGRTFEMSLLMFIVVSLCRSDRRSLRLEHRDEMRTTEGAASSVQAGGSVENRLAVTAG